MIKFRIAALGVLFSTSAFTQILTSSPLFPTSDDTVTIIFDAAKGNQGLVGAGEVYAHTGVLTDKSTSAGNWRYVKTQWGVNTAETKLQSLGNNKWKIRFHIRRYYGVPPSEKILNLAFVFRNGTSSREGKTETGGDIFYPVYEQGLQITLLSPVEPYSFRQPGESLQVLAVGARAVKMSLYLDEVLLYSVNNDSLSFSLSAPLGKKQVRVTAQDSSAAAKSLSFSFIVHKIDQVADLPAGVQDGINYTSHSTATLVLQAPLKRFIYVLGDFNKWDVAPEYMMNRTPDGRRFWLNLTGLQQGKEYIFQYLVEGSIKIADPYAEKISDPWNDSYISSSTYPGLLPYPVDKTTEIAAVLQTGAQPYPWKTNGFIKPAKTDLVIYELLLRDFLANHDYRTLSDTLAYLQRLGINAIELMPISEFEGNLSWGYNPSFYFAPDKYYGPKQDLQRLIDLAHQHGMAVIQDMVLNHSYGQSPFVRLYAADMAGNPWYNAQSPNPVYSWGYDFNHTSAATQALVDRVTSFWINEYHVDGFRFDFTKGFTNTPGDGWAYDEARIAILKRMADHIWSVDPSAYVILEHFTDNIEERVLTDYGMMVWGNMNYNYNEATMGYHAGKSDLTRTLYTARGWSKPHLIAYMESHDEERLMFKNIAYGNSASGYSIKDTTTALKRMELAAVFFLSIPGPKMIWQFGEMGYDYSIDLNGRTGNKPLRWNYLRDPRRDHLWQVMSKLIKLKIEHPAFETGDFSLAGYPPVKRLNLNHDSANFTILGNFDVSPASIDPAFQHSGWWYDYLSADSVWIQNAHGLIAMNPGEYHVYSDKKIEWDARATGIQPAIAQQPTAFKLDQNYPNPFNHETVLSYSLAKAGRVRMDIFNIRGEQICTISAGFQQAGAHHFTWDGRNESGVLASSGIYIVRLRGEQMELKIRMVLLR